jgi:hypothetical protein
MAIGDGDRRSAMAIPAMAMAMAIPAIGDPGDRRWRSAIGDGRCLLLTVSNKTWAVWAMPKQSPACAGDRMRRA